MIRFTLLWLFVVTVSVYAWKDWFKALCGLILMMAVIQHPDMPKSLAGIQGLNPWNVVLASTMGAWLVARQREGSQWDIPRHIAVLFVLYMGVAFIAFVRMMLDSDALHEPMGYLVGEHLINVFKWVIPGIMLFDGCRTRARFKWAIFSVLALYFLLAVQVIRWVPLEYAMEGDKLQARSHKVIAREIGYHRVNMSMMLAGASWAIFVVGATARSWSPRLLLLAASLVVVFGQSLTAGRAGYGTWAVIGLLLCLVRWKRYLFLAPVVAFGLVSFVPGVSERMLTGFSEETHDSNQLVQEAMNQEEQVQLDGSESETDLYTVTSGRAFAWPFVIEKIEENRIVGYGKEAMRRTGLTDYLMEEFGEGFPHPHNAYLELLLDTGYVGFAIVVPFFLLVLYRAFSLFRDSRSPVFVSIGGITCALVLALLVAGMGSQSFYPREGSVGMWAAIGLMFRVAAERRRALASMTEQTNDVTATSALGHFPRPRPTAPVNGLQRTARSNNAAGTVRTPTGDLDARLWRTAA